MSEQQKKAGAATTPEVARGKAFKIVASSPYGKFGVGAPGKYEHPVVQRTHELKTWPEHFQAAVSGEKRFEVRVNDRDFRVGDMLRLREWDPVNGAYTNREVKQRVTHILLGGQFGIAPTHCVMSLTPSYFSA